VDRGPRRLFRCASAGPAILLLRPDRPAAGPLRSASSAFCGRLPDGRARSPRRCGARTSFSSVPRFLQSVGQKFSPSRRSYSSRFCNLRPPRRDHLRAPPTQGHASPWAGKSYRVSSSRSFRVRRAQIASEPAWPSCADRGTDRWTQRLQTYGRGPRRPAGKLGHRPRRRPCSASVVPQHGGPLRESSMLFVVIAALHRP